MQVKDIVNRDVVTLSNCADEPIHIPGSIQPHGFLLAIKKTDDTIEFCSSNAATHTGVPVASLLGNQLSDIIGATAFDSLRQYMNTMPDDHSGPWQLQLAGRPWWGIIHHQENLYVIELEPVSEEPSGLSNPYLQTRRITGYLRQATTLQNLCQSVADEIRSITGYDRVMIYRFDEVYNGEVFAESVTAEQESFLGLHYPHTDIPPQARDLYVRNLLRIIVDVSYLPVPIMTLDDAPDKNLDLGMAALRSVSPIHIQYLQNMGVAGTLTISLLHEGKLWGLIACHHYTPKYLTRFTRVSALLQGHFLTSQISVRMLGEEYAMASDTSLALDRMRERLFASEHPQWPVLTGEADLLSLTNASGVVLLLEDKVYTQGVVPEHEEILKMATWLQAYTTAACFSTEHLSALYPGSKKWKHLVSGILFHSLGSGAGNCIVWCRPEALQEIHWAGDPEKAIVRDEAGLSPRRSFQRYREIRQGESNKWRQPELAVAANFANALQKQVHIQFLTREELKQRTLSAKLMEANAELENLNWISSHDLKEPLRKIQMFASRIFEQDGERDYGQVLQLVKKMSSSAQRMQLLIADILSYSRVNHTDEVLKAVSLNEVVIELINDLAEEIAEKKAIVHVGELPTVSGLPFLLHQLFANLLHNALKFSKPGTVPVITIVQEPDHAYAPGGTGITTPFSIVRVTDNGIGFDNQFQENIFKVFARLHSTDEDSGSGVGLALCRKIMKTHNGYITAAGSPDNGASFALFFPK